jgi:hypothetical protein
LPRPSAIEDGAVDHLNDRGGDEGFERARRAGDDRIVPGTKPTPNKRGAFARIFVHMRDPGAIGLSTDLDAINHETWLDGWRSELSEDDIRLVCSVLDR